MKPTEHPSAWRAELVARHHNLRAPSPTPRCLHLLISPDWQPHSIPNGQSRPSVTALTSPILSFRRPCRVHRQNTWAERRRALTLPDPTHHPTTLSHPSLPPSLSRRLSQVHRQVGGAGA